LIDIEVAFASPNAQVLIPLVLADGATVEDAIRAAQLDAAFPQYDFSKLAVGIWGKLVPREQRLSRGDRVEIYRELVRNPMEARRLRALGLTPGPCESR